MYDCYATLRFVLFCNFTNHDCFVLMKEYEIEFIYSFSFRLLRMMNSSPIDSQSTVYINSICEDSAFITLVFLANQRNLHYWRITLLIPSDIARMAKYDPKGYVSMTNESTYEDMNDIIQRNCELLALDYSTCLTFLLYYHWNTDKFQDDFVSCEDVYFSFNSL